MDFNTRTNSADEIHRKMKAGKESILSENARLKAELAAARAEVAGANAAFNSRHEEIEQARRDRDAALAGAEHWKANFECVERAGAEQARRADQCAIDLAAAKAEVERLRALCDEWLRFSDDIVPSCAAGYDLMSGLRQRTKDAAGRGEGER